MEICQTFLFLSSPEMFWTSSSLKNGVRRSRANCSYSSLVWVYTVCPYTYSSQMMLANICSRHIKLRRRHFQIIFAGAMLTVKATYYRIINTCIFLVHKYMYKNKTVRSHCQMNKIHVQIIMSTCSYSLNI